LEERADTEEKINSDLNITYKLNWLVKFIVHMWKVLKCGAGE
jgi:hypothetical protein